MDDECDKPSREDNLAACYEAMDNMSIEVRDAVIEVTNWMVSERPKDAEPASQLMMETWVAEVMERDRRRRSIHRPSAAFLPFRPTK